MSNNIPNTLPATAVAVMALVGTTFSNGVMSDLFCVSLALTSAWLIGMGLTVILHSLVERGFNVNAAATDESEIEGPLTDRQRKRRERRSKRASAALRRR